MKRTERILSVAALAGAALLLVAMFLPWHDVHRIHWEGAFCWAPDCHAEVYTESRATHCTGYTHLGAPVLGMLLAFAGLEILLLARPAMRRRWLVALAGLGLVSATVVLAALDAALSHMLDNVVTHPGEPLFGIAAGLLDTVVLVQALVAIVAAVREARAARAARAAAGIPEPSPEERRGRRDLFLDRAARVLALAGLVSTAVLAVLLFLPWHRVPDVFEECAWGVQDSACPRDLNAVTHRLCTGLDHYPGLMPIVLGAVLACQVWLVVRAKARRGLLPSFVLGGLVVCFLFLFFNPHAAYHWLIGEDLGNPGIWEGAAWGLTIGAALQLVVAVVRRWGNRTRVAGPAAEGKAGPATEPDQPKGSRNDEVASTG